MILYLQSNYNGTFALSEKNMHKDMASDNPMDWCDFFTLEDNLPHDMTFLELYLLIIDRKYNCKKLIIQL